MKMSRLSSMDAAPGSHGPLPFRLETFTAYQKHLIYENIRRVIVRCYLSLPEPSASAPIVTTIPLPSRRRLFDLCSVSSLHKRNRSLCLFQMAPWMEIKASREFRRLPYMDISRFVKEKDLTTPLTFFWFLKI